MKKWWLFLVLYTSFPGAHPSIYAEPSFRVDLDRQKVFLDQTCVLKIQFEWPKKEAHYVFAVPDPVLQKIQIQRRGESQETLVREGLEWTLKTFIFELQPLEAGAATIAEFQVRYVDSDSQKQGGFLVPEFSIQVLRPRNTRWVFWTGAAAFPLAVFIAALLGIRARLKGREILESPSPPSFFDKLQGIRERTNSGTASKEILYDLSKEFRNFLVQRYELTHPDATEDELIKEIQTKELSLDEKKLITALLSQLQEAKYVQKNIAGPDFKRLMDSVLEFVEKRRVIINS